MHLMMKKRLENIVSNFNSLEQRPTEKTKTKTTHLLAILY